MILKRYFNNKRFLVIILSGIVLIGAGYLLRLRTDSINEPIFCTQEAKLCPDGSYVGRTGPNCEFAECPEIGFLPDGYTLENYSIEKVLDGSCLKHSDCQTPGEYLIQSRCPFTSLCLENKCTVICPESKDATWTEAK